MAPPSPTPVPDAGDLHALALEAFADDRHGDALALLIEGAAEQVDLELLNDLGVAAYAMGLFDESRALLRTVLFLDPTREDARENLRAAEHVALVTAAPARTPARTFDAAAYWEDRLAGEFGLGEVGFIGLGEGFNTWMYRVRRHVFCRHARAMRRDWSTARVLDVGSGTGFYVENWLKLGVKDLTASDITNAAVDRLRGRHPGIAVHRIDIGDDIGQLAPASYDAISAFDVLFHIVDDEAFARAMRNMATLLKPEGTLLFSDNFLHAERRAVRHHVSRSLEEIEAAVAGAGLEIVRRRPSFVLMNDPVDTKSARHRRWWQDLTKRLRDKPERGGLIGAALFPVEVAATRILREGPSTEIMVCRRPAA